jgi:hypothetical protein
LFCNESADIVDGKAFAQRRVKRCHATDGHDEVPIRYIHATACKSMRP